MSGGQGVAFVLLLGSQWALSLGKPLTVCVKVFWGVQTHAGMADSDHTCRQWLTGFPYDGVVPGAERTTEMGV